MPLTLLRQGSPLSDADKQRTILASGQHAEFDEILVQHKIEPLQASGVAVLQVNVGKLCNQTCRHCHVDAGPDRREIMSQAVLHACLEALRNSDIPIVDITGGAPEMNPHFRWFVSEVRALGRQVIDRCNLTILLTPGHQDLPEFLAANQVEIVASLPCYLEENTDRQRGQGVFAKSIEALRRLNELGYGSPESGLLLNLVFNPIGPVLPPSQPELEAAYRRELLKRYGIVFSRLYCITNMPISRFLDDLLHTGRYVEYLQKLIDAFNPAAVPGVMCRTMLSVDWEGRLYDCDFNQMLELGLHAAAPQTIFDVDLGRLKNRRIVTGRHCFGCTAGCGSSCQGSIAE